MIGTIRKHQAWLWYIIIAATIISFVVLFMPNVRSSAGDFRHADLGKIDGKAITPEDYTQAKYEESVDFFINYGSWPEDEERVKMMGVDLKEKAYQRLFLKAKVKEARIEISDGAVLRRIHQYLGVKPGEDLSKERYGQFISEAIVKSSRLNPQYAVFLFEETIRTDLGIDELITLNGMSGQMITPDEVRSFYDRENESVHAQAVIFNASNFTNQVPTELSALQQFFTNNQAYYRIPERVEVAYIKFDMTNYVAEVVVAATNLDKQIDDYYSQHPNTIKTPDGKVMTEIDAKAQLKKQAIEQSALGLADKKAKTFIIQAYEHFTNTFTADGFKAFAKENKLTVDVSEPFDSTGPKNLKVGRDFISAALSLTPDSLGDPSDTTHRSLLYSKPLSGEDCFYVIALQNRIPGRPQTFDEVKDDVTHSMLRYKGQELAKEAGRKFGTAVTNGLATGKSFDALCAESSLKPLDVPPFSLASTTNTLLVRGMLEKAQQSVENLAVKNSTGFIEFQDGGFVLYITDRKPADAALAQSQMPAYTEQMRNKRKIAAFSQWFSKNFPVSVRRPVEKEEIKKK